MKIPFAYYFHKNNQMQNVRDNSYFIMLGYNVNSKMAFKCSYTYIETETITKIGSPAPSVSNEKHFGNNSDNMQLMMFEFNYKF